MTHSCAEVLTNSRLGEKFWLGWKIGQLRNLGRFYSCQGRHKNPLFFSLLSYSSFELFFFSEFRCSIHTHSLTIQVWSSTNVSQFGVAKRENKKQREKVIDTGVIKSQTHIDAHLVGEKIVFYEKLTKEKILWKPSGREFREKTLMLQSWDGSSR